MALTEREEIVDQEEIVGDFPGGPFLVRELRSHMPWSTAKKNKIK